MRTGEVAPAELVEAAIARVEALNPELNAVIHELFEEAREAARGEIPDGPFRGVPFMLKDLGATLAGQPLHLGMQALKDVGFRAPVDTVLGAALSRRRAGHDRRRRTPRSSGILPTTEPRAYGPTPQPLGHRADHRWLERRLRRRGRRRDGRDRARQRRRRLDPDPRRQLRAGRAEADGSGSARGRWSAT